MGEKKGFRKEVVGKIKSSFEIEKDDKDNIKVVAHKVYEEKEDKDAKPAGDKP